MSGDSSVKNNDDKNSITVITNIFVFVWCGQSKFDFFNIPTFHFLQSLRSRLYTEVPCVNPCIKECT